MNKRIMIVGSSGIISHNLQKKLKEKKLKFVTFGRKNANLKKNSSYKKLSKKIKNRDIVIFISAQAPAKNMQMFFDNIKICESEEEAVDLIDTISNEHNNNKPYILNNKENIKQFLDNHISNENSLHIS